MLYICFFCFCFVFWKINKEKNKARILQFADRWRFTIIPKYHKMLGHIPSCGKHLELHMQNAHLRKLWHQAPSMHDLHSFVQYRIKEFEKWSVDANRSFKKCLRRLISLHLAHETDSTEQKGVLNVAEKWNFQSENWQLTTRPAVEQLDLVWLRKPKIANSQKR